MHVFCTESDVHTHLFSTRMQSADGLLSAPAKYSEYTRTSNSNQHLNFITVKRVKASCALRLWTRDRVPSPVVYESWTLLYPANPTCPLA